MSTRDFMSDPYRKCLPAAPSNSFTVSSVVSSVDTSNRWMKLSWIVSSVDETTDESSLDRARAYS
jgi:hypothetical protein